MSEECKPEDSKYPEWLETWIKCGYSISLPNTVDKNGKYVYKVEKFKSRRQVVQDKLLTVGVLVVGLVLGALAYNMFGENEHSRHYRDHDKCGCSDEGKCKCRSEGCGCPKGRRLGDLPSGDLPKGK